MCKKYLALDIGGTNCRLALYDAQLHQLKKLNVLTKNVHDIIPFIEEMNTSATICCIGFAGPIQKNKATLTNGNLTLNTNHILKKTALKHVHLINDFVATGYGIIQLKKNNKLKTKTLQKKKQFTQMNIAIGPGTGLGMSYFSDNKVYATEAGQKYIHILNKMDSEIVQFLKTNKKVKPTYEEVLSGRGLLHLYAFLAKKYKKRKKFTDLLNKETIHKAEYLHSTSSTDALSHKTLQLFATYYLRFIRENCLAPLTSHVYLVGGITKTLLPYLKQEIKNQKQNAKKKNISRQISISLVLNHDVGLLGAAHIAKFAKTQ